ncbi:MAG: bifunctional glutamate N-acetyltransferase/amino-acid acetyltransferase ArgJ [Chloroflexota bacterium]
MVQVKPTIEHVDGFRVAGVHAGLKKDNALDFALFVSDTDCATGALFTTNTVKAACVLVDMEIMSTHSATIRAVAVNTKCANACTGEQGITNAKETAKQVAEKIGCAPEQVLVLSTGVIGTQLPMDKITNGINLAYNALGDCWPEAADGIRTTDTRSKMASAQITLSSGKTVQIAGVSKGSGMIAPNMATMLGVLVTNAALSVEETQGMLARANETTFNRIVVDGDTSTNDTVFLLANGASGAALETDADRIAFAEALEAVARKLAHDIVRDGEGVTKFVTLHVLGATTNEAAKQIASTIATSPLVKTALFGSDANWGRIVAAAGRAGVPFDPMQATLLVQGGESLAVTPENGAVVLFKNGMPTDYSEDDAMAVMAHDSITICLKCGIGDGEAVVWTCDLSYDYVKINGDYRT